MILIIRLVANYVSLDFSNKDYDAGTLKTSSKPRIINSKYIDE